MLTKLTTTLIAACALIGSAPAASAGKLICKVQDTSGNHMVYMFGSNSTNADGSYGGTMVETGYERNGRVTFSERGVRPIWIYGGNAGGGLNLYSRADPGWSLSVAGDGSAMLLHGGRFAGNGGCSGGGATAGNVRDMGTE
jgi:hypothetical protein